MWRRNPSGRAGRGVASGRFLVWTIAMGCVAGVAAAGRQQPMFRGAGDAVHLFVTVTDPDGRLVTTLTRDDFVVRDEGTLQPVTLFDNSQQPIQLVVMLDVSGSMEGNLPLLRDSAEQLFARLGPDDRARVGTFGRDIVISPAFTRDPRVLRASLPDRIAPDAPTPLWRGIEEALGAFDAGDGRRRVILVLSDGRDSGSIAFGRRVVTQADIVERARSEDVMIYAIGTRSRTAPRAAPAPGAGRPRAARTAALPDPGLARVAEETGGGYAELRDGEDLGAAFARVADELHTQYVLGFAPPARDGRVHAVEVGVLPRGLKARARKSYVAPGP